MIKHKSKFKYFNKIGSMFTNKGQTLVELLVVIGLASILLPAIITGFVTTREGKVSQQQRKLAIDFLQEAENVARSVREKGWTELSTNGIYHPEIAVDNSWSLVSGSETVNGFTRQIEISDVCRVSSGPTSGTIGDCGVPGNNIDLSTKKIKTTVSWSLPLPSSLDSTLYLTRHLENATYTETTQTQFNGGTQTGVNVRATLPPLVADDGEIILGAGGHSDWCTPSLTANTLDLPGSGYASSITAIENRAFAGTGENASGLSFMDINISPSTPPVPTMGSTFDGDKTNGVFGDASYGYITTDTNSKEVVIINIASSPYTEAGYFDAPGNGNGDGIFVKGSVGYMTTATNKLYSFDISSASTSKPILDPDGVTLAGRGTSIYIVEPYAYVSISGNTSTELQIVDISDPSNLQVVGQANVDSQGAVDVHVNDTAGTGTRAYLATGADINKREVFIIDISTKTGNRPAIGTGYDTNGMDPKGITIVPGNRVIVVGRSGQQYQVINIADESSPFSCGGTTVTADIHDVASIIDSSGNAYSYIVTSDASSEFKIIEGGPGGSYAATGIFESETFNPGYSTANNRLTATFSEPVGTNIQFQVSLAALVGGVCPTTGNYTFVGPSGNSSDYFEQPSGVAVTFPFANFLNYSNPGQCFRYKAILSTTDPSNTPVLKDVTINYSP